MSQSHTTTPNPIANVDQSILIDSVEQSKTITSNDQSILIDCTKQSKPIKPCEREQTEQTKLSGTSIFDKINSITNESDDEDDDTMPTDIQTIKQILAVNTNVPLWESQLKMVSRCVQIENQSIGQNVKLEKLIAKFPLNPTYTPDQEKIANAKFMFELNKIVGESFGVMADKPGTGKTYVVLALIMLNLYQKPNLIVVPQNIFSQWDSEIKKFCGNKFIKYKKILEYSDTIDVLTNPTSLLSNDIILVTPLHYYMITSALIRTRQTIGRIFFDEIDTLDQIVKEPLCAVYTWFVSASFRGNKIGCYQMDQSKINKNMCLIGDTVELETPETQTINSDENTIKILKSIVSDKKIGELNGLDFRTDNSFFEFNKKTTQSDLDFLKLTICELNTQNKEYTSRLDELTSIKFDEEELERDFKLKLKKESIEKEKKIYWDKLATTWEKIKKINKYFQIDSNGFIDWDLIRDKIKPSNKFDKIKELIIQKYNKNNKILIYSDYSVGINKLLNWLDENNYSYTNFECGNHADITKALAQYKNSAIPILIVNDFMYACGMNLEFTTDLILTHKLEPLNESQVIGRAQRYGRTSKLKIYKFLNSNENS